MAIDTHNPIIQGSTSKQSSQRQNEKEVEYGHISLHNSAQADGSEEWLTYLPASGFIEPSKATYKSILRDALQNSQIPSYSKEGKETLSKGFFSTVSSDNNY